jgi:hypothetical protein
VSGIRWERGAGGMWRGFDGDSGSVIARVSRGRTGRWVATADMSLLPGSYVSGEAARWAVLWFMRDQNRFMQARWWWLGQVEAARKGFGPRLSWGQLGQAHRYGVDTAGAEL